MKHSFFTFFLILIFLTSCKSSVESVKMISGYYDYMQFERAGGGQIDFRLFKTEDSNKLIALVSKYNFRDTTIQIIIDKDIENTASFSNFKKALNNQMQLSGEFVESKLPTGTWVFISFCKNDMSAQVTNIELRNSLLKIERLVRNNIR